MLFAEATHKALIFSVAYLDNLLALRNPLCSALPTVGAVLLMELVEYVVLL